MNDPPDMSREREAGRTRLDRMIDSFDASWIRQIAEAAEADRVREQPWLIAGVSDGMGLHVTLAALEAGVLESGVGVYYEPPTLLERDEEGEPVSPVHWARYQNALALESLAADRGVELDVLSADMILAPQRGLKGDIKGELGSIPEEVRESVEAARRSATREDLVLIDSVALGKWICPREGHDPVEVPNIDFQGRVVPSKTKQYHPRGYQETLDTMGRNHGWLLEQCRELGWFGPQTITTFFTWAGGSQHVEVLEGIYGRGSLGDAKIIAEREVAEFRMEHGTDLGAHGIVRFPAFLSAALMAIPGGGLFGLVSRRLLEARGLHRDIPELAANMLSELLGRAWVRENPIAQIELDSAESLYLSTIADRVEEARERIASHRASQDAERRDEPIPLETSRDLLEGLVPPDYPAILSRFRPDDQEVDASSRPFDFEVSLSDRPPRTHLWASSLPSLHDLCEHLEISTDPSVLEDELHVGVDRHRIEALTHGHLEADTFERQREMDRLVCRRQLFDSSGTELVQGRTTLVYGDSSEVEDPEALGTPIGYRRTIDATFLRDFTPFSDRTDSMAYSAALSGFAESALREAGLLGRITPGETWSIGLYRTPSSGDVVLTYVRPKDDPIEASVVDGDGETLMVLRASPGRAT